MRSYEAARSLFSFLAFIAWSTIIMGALVALVSAGTFGQFGGPGAGLLAMVPGFGIAIAGFIQLAFVQIGRAGVDTAEYTQQMLKISRDQLEVSQQALSNGNAAPKSFSNLSENTKPLPKAVDFSEATRTPEPAAQPIPEPVSLVEKQIEYQGRVIVSNGETHRVDHAEFKQIKHAKEHIDLLLQKDGLAAQVAELQAIKIPKLDPILSTREPVHLQANATENTPKSQRQEPKFK